MAFLSGVCLCQEARQLKNGEEGVVGLGALPPRSESRDVEVLMSLSLSLDQEGLKMTLLTLLHIRNAGLMIK